MRDLFADAARRHAGLAATALGWKPADFWAATPSELAISLAPPTGEGQPPTRAEIDTLIERDSNGR